MSVLHFIILIEDAKSDEYTDNEGRAKPTYVRLFLLEFRSSCNVWQVWFDAHDTFWNLSTFCLARTWSMGSNPTWTLNGTALGPNTRSMVGERLVSNEPMYLILNLVWPHLFPYHWLKFANVLCPFLFGKNWLYQGISDTFVPINKRQLKFPAQLLIDYVRVVNPKISSVKLLLHYWSLWILSQYQPKGRKNLGCSTKEYPTED